MADESADVLRRSLDAVDRHRRRLTIGLGATTVLFLLAFFAGAHLTRNMEQAILAHVMLLGVWVTVLTLIVVIHTTVMTKRVLRAIELAVRK
jgi:hypothetical protein